MQQVKKIAQYRVRVWQFNIWSMTGRRKKRADILCVQEIQWKRNDLEMDMSYIIMEQMNKVEVWVGLSAMATAHKN